MAAPNIVNVVNMVGKTTPFAVTTTTTSVVSNNLNSGQLYKINSIVVSNISGSATTITASVYRSGTPYYFAYNISVPVGATLVVMDKASTIYLEEGDAIQLTAGFNSALHAVVSYEILS